MRAKQKINRKTVDINSICYLSVLYINELNSKLKGFLHWIKFKQLYVVYKRHTP